MYTGCPMCSTLLQVTEEQLAIKHGMVRCGHCNEVFDASDHCHEEMHLAMSRPDRDGPETPELQPPELAQDSSQDEVADAIETASTEIGADGESEPTERASEQASEPVPWEQAPSRASSMPTFRFVLWSVALLVLMAGQLWHFERDQILQMPQWRPYLERVAQTVHLEMPLYKDRAALTIISRELRQHPDQAHAMRFRLTIQNQAPYRQSYPVVRLSLNDEQQQVVARQDFTPRDYLQTTGIEEGLAVQASANLTIDFIAPQQPVDGFLFDLI